MAQKTIGVVGAGTMGHGIAQVSATSGFATVLVDVNETLLEQGVGRIAKSLEKLVRKEKMSEEERKAALERITKTTDLAHLAQADVVVEAATEALPVKLELFRKLDAASKPGALLATNTSSISITRIAAATRRPEAVIGMHFMNPVPLMTLVEVVRGECTTDETVKATHELATAMGKTPVTVNDFPGFVANRILMPMINEGIYALMEGVATREAIDTVMKLGTNQPMGPLALADLIGLDVCLAIMEVLHRDFADSKYRPCPLLTRMVNAGKLGRKSGAGFYEYAS